MLPRDSGGVVDTSLLVYGTSNLRVVDASIMPLQVGAHLMAPTVSPSSLPLQLSLDLHRQLTRPDLLLQQYGIAEKAADIIKAKYAFVPPPSSSAVAASSAAFPASSGVSQTTIPPEAVAPSATAGIVNANGDGRDPFGWGEGRDRCWCSHRSARDRSGRRAAVLEEEEGFFCG